MYDDHAAFAVFVLRGEISIEVRGPIGIGLVDDVLSIPAEFYGDQRYGRVQGRRLVLAGLALSTAVSRPELPSISHAPS